MSITLCCLVYEVRHDGHAYLGQRDVTPGSRTLSHADRKRMITGSAFRSPQGAEDCPHAEDPGPA